MNMGKQRPRVLLIDRDRLFGAALTTLLTTGMTVVGVHASVDAALADMDTGSEPDFIIVDPGQVAPAERANVLGRLRAAAPRAGLMVLSNDISPSALQASLQYGVDAHIAKSASLEQVRRAMHLVRHGQSVYPAQAAGLWGEPIQMSPTVETQAALSPREVQILACLLGGQSNKAIARRLSITESTVKMHFKNVMRKIKAANRTQAAVWAIDHGIAPLAA